MPEASPLDWPAGWPRSKTPCPSRFLRSSNGAGWDARRHSLAESRDAVLIELGRLGGERCELTAVVSSNLELRLDGLPRSGQRQPADKGVAVYFQLKGEWRVLACDAWDRIECNLWAVAKTIEAMRGIDRWGVTEMLSRAFSGFKALPEKGSGTAWWEVLKISSEACAADPELVRANYRILAHQRHPDKGGTREAWDRLQEAWAQAKAVFAGKGVTL